jgi:MurNAc alpha-1-phosphate uridylyltransferase
MIMAAGLGTRMRPLTNDRPKPLVEVRGKALIDHAIDRLVAAGVTLIVINTHYKAQMLTDHLAARKDVEIRISPETDEILGTGGGILKALPHFEGQPFFVHNSDSVWVEGLGHALERMKDRWDADNMDALLLMASMVTSLGFEGTGDFNMDGDGRLTRVPPLRLSPYAYPGVQIVHPRLFDHAPGRSFSMNVLWDVAIEHQRLYGIRLDGVWMHVGTPDAVREADEFLDDLVLA